MSPHVDAISDSGIAGPAFIFLTHTHRTATGTIHVLLDHDQLLVRVDIFCAIPFRLDDWGKGERFIEYFISRRRISGIAQLRRVNL